MGCFQARDDLHSAVGNSAAINALVKENRISARILLLGSGDTGKSTFLKQMKLIHFQDLPTIENHRTAITVRQSLLEGTKLLIPHFKDKISPELQNIANQLLAENAAEPNSEILLKIQALWATGPMKQAFLQKTKLKLDIDSNLDHFFNRIDTVAQETYVPSVEDILQARTKTTGVNQVTINVKRKDSRGGEFTFQIELIDTGGQRSERRKWLHHFDSVDVVIYFSSLEGYAMDMHEEAMNRLQDDLRLFSQLMGMEDVLQKKNWYLFLNKVDLFEARLKEDPLSNYYPEIPAESASDPVYCTKFIEKLFRDRWTGENLTVYTTNVLDKKQVETIFVEAQNVYLSQSDQF